MLYIVCTVCSNPLVVGKEAEHYLIGSSHIQCSECEQWSEVSKELKNFIRKSKGMKPIE